MAPKYRVWISKQYPTWQSALGKCREAVLAMVKAFPELRKTNGFVHFHELSSVEPRAHWWLKDRAGKIVDPTAHQFPEYCGFPILRYEEIDDSHDARKFEQARCHNCGDYYYLNPEIKLKGVMHNEDCNRAYVNYLNGVD